MADEPQDVAPQPDAEPTWSPESNASELRSVAKELGYTDDDLSQFKDDRQLATSLFQIAGEYGKYREEAEKVAPFVQLGQKVAPYADKLSEFEKWVQDQQKAPVKEEGPAFSWQAPDYDPTWEQADMESDPVGYAQAQAKLKRYKQFEQDTLRGLVRNPQELIGQVVAPTLAEREKAIREYVQQAVQEERTKWQWEQQQTVSQTEEQTWLRENANQFYVHDASGNPVMGNDGRMVPTDVGRKAWEQYQWARSLRGQDGNALPVNQAVQIAMAQMPRVEKQEPEAAPQRFLDTVTEAERYPERRQGVADDSAPPSMYPDEEDQFDAAIRQAAKLEGVSLSR